MYYEVAKEIFDKLPTACFGAVAVRGLDNTRPIPALETMLLENIKVCEAYFEDKKPKETPDILLYREAFRALDINPNKYLCSIEALLTRIARKKGFPSINAAVDLGNAISIKYHLPIGAHDLDTMDGGLDVRLAQPVPVYWVYITAWATPDGIDQFRDDIYNRDGLGISPAVAVAPGGPGAAQQKTGALQPMEDE